MSEVVFCQPSNETFTRFDGKAAISYDQWAKAILIRNQSKCHISSVCNWLWITCNVFIAAAITHTASTHRIGTQIYFNHSTASVCLRRNETAKSTIWFSQRFWQHQQLIKSACLVISHPHMTNAPFSQSHWNAACINDFSYKEQKKQRQLIYKQLHCTRVFHFWLVNNQNDIAIPVNLHGFKKCQHVHLSRARKKK